MTPGIQPTLVLVLFLVPTAISNSTFGTTTNPDHELATTTALDANISNENSKNDRKTTIIPSTTALTSTHRPISAFGETQTNGHHSTTTIAHTDNSISTTSIPSDHHTSTTPLSHHNTTSTPSDHHTSTTPLSHHNTTLAPSDHHTSTTPLSHRSTTSGLTDHHTSTTPLSHHSTTSAPTDHHTSTAPLSHHSTTSAPTDHHTSTTPTSHHRTTATKNTGTTIATTGYPKSISSTFHQKPTPTPNNYHSSISQPITISQSTSQLPVVIYESAMFFLSFHILNKNFNSSLENPSSSYYQDLKNSVNDLLQQTYKNNAFVTFYLLQFRKGSVITDCILVFREGSITTSEVQNLFAENAKESSMYNLHISPSDITVREWNSKASSTDSAVPGYAIALLVIVCILLALAIFHLAALGLSQFRRKHCGQLDIFPSQDSYHPMNEYPPYHTHGRYVPPSNTKRSPYEEISPGNGGNSLSYVNPVATSANL
ncbi:mucin-1 [Vombatus ursinus]|uniref:mucin-1 n=1 Tax=Vombatus ursinus TaxID=29139 RepID=UPI000FFD8CBC|nr:mucin-1 [Vombatus ursinus]